ncbi:MAG TPA: DUF58 domain-containing protein [Tetrasphaera sp.]|uniref:DUF58 domain-containing protein n=1 Tax=Nostocoides sp. TaxID=1917966 RepID=UPI002D162FFC|nr:DUF58 domain-containing protein [Tetrasphaera sp.]HNQ05729.1 DUF58 domain-containing protein [Tetrasphaera sp.]
MTTASVGLAWRRRVWSLRDRAVDLVGPRTAPVLAAVRPWTRSVTGLGWVVLGGGLLALVVGRDQGWTELTVVGLTFLVVTILALAWTLGRAAYDADIVLDRDRVSVGEKAFGAVTVRNRAGRMLLPARMELPVGSGVASFDLPALAKDADHEVLFSVPTRQRGVIAIGPVRSVRGDPLGLLRRMREWTGAHTLYVHPATVPIEASTKGFLKDIEGVTTHDLASSDVAFHALRDYVQGDDLRTVHWRTTARVGRLMVRQFEETRRSHLLLILSVAEADYADADEFEVAVSSVGSMALQALREERQVSVVAGRGRIRFATGAALLDQLAPLSTDGRAKPLRDLAADAVALVPSASMAALVTGSLPTPRVLRAAHLAVPAQVAAFAVRCVTDGQCTRRRISTLTVIDVPTLADLPRAVRSIR